MNATNPEDIIARARYVLLGFDGLLCTLFTESYPAAMVADEVRQILQRHDVELPKQIHESTHPLEILRYAHTLQNPALMCKAEDTLCTAELDAVRTALPNPHSRGIIVAAHWSGRRVAVVSNISANAISAYLIRERIYTLVHPIVGRAYGDPSITRPSPSPIIWAMHQLQARPHECVFIGTSATDVEAARAANVPVIGYTEQPHNLSNVTNADAIISSTVKLARILDLEQPQRVGQ